MVCVEVVTNQINRIHYYYYYKPKKRRFMYKSWITSFLVIEKNRQNLKYYTYISMYFMTFLTFLLI